jgi:triosephosphate isomerase
MRVLVNFCRVLLGLTFMFSGIVKAIDPVGTQIKLNDYLYAFSMGGMISASTLLILACLLAGLEILIGTYMALGAFIRGTSFLMLAFMAVFTPFTLYLALKNPVSDCGCFGDAVVITNWQTFLKNVFLLILALVVFIGRKKVVPFVSERRQWVVTVFVTAIAVRFMVSNILNLPVLDFRPYKVGTNLRTAILDNQDPTFADFYLMDDNLDDVTGSLLTDSSYTFLLIVSHVEDASESNLDLIDDVFDYCAHWGYNMYGVTASGRDAVKQWAENTGSDIKFLFCDEIPLETMVRSNPGLVLLHDGVIVNKWSHSCIPADEELSGPLEEISVGSMPGQDPFKTPWAVAGLFILPLLMIVLIDRLKVMIQ